MRLQGFNSKALASLLISILLVSGSYTNVPNSYQTSRGFVSDNVFQAAFADDGDNNRRHNEDKDDERDDLEDKTEELVEDYEELIEDLGKISDISDKAVITDYLVAAITDLKEDTENLVSDKNVKKHLLKILDNALNRVQKAGDKVLNLKEKGANQELEKSRKLIEQYIDKVEKFKGSRIQTDDADFLISKADKILSDSMKSGTEIVVIIVDTPLVVTDELINKAKDNVLQLRQIVAELKSLGFIVTLDATKNSPTATSISFSNDVTLQIFDIIIPDSALATLTALGFSEESLNAGIVLSTEELAALMNISPIIVNNVVNSEDMENSVIFAVFTVCPANFSVEECKATFASPDVIGGRFAIGVFAKPFIDRLVAVGSAVLGSIIGSCVRNLDDCNAVIEEAIHHIAEIGLESALEGIDNSLPTLHVIKNVVNDNGGTKIPSDFTVRVIFGDEPEEIVLFGAGEPGSTIRLPPGNFVVREDSDPAYTKNIPDSSGCDDRIDVGQTRTCTIINDDVPPLPTTETICDDGIDNDGDGIIDSGDSDCPPPPPLFSENFDGDVSRWPKTCSGCTELRRSAAGPHGEEPPSHPNWGFVGQSFSSPFCTNDLQGRMTNTFFVPTEGDYMVSGVVGGGVCDVCTMTGRVIVSDVVVLEGRGTNLSTGITRHPEFKENTIHLTRGTHFIGLEMHSTFACNGFFYGVFDNIKIEGPISTPLVSSLADMNGGPYFDVQIDQTSVNVSRPDTVTIPLQVNWSDGYEAEPVNVSVIGLNGTGITHSVSSITNSQFEVVFEIPSGVEIGEYQFLISVREAESDDVVGTGITFNVE